LSKEKNKLVSSKRIPFEEGNEKFWDLSADIFIPAAKSRLVDKAKLEKLMAGGLTLIASGANFPFAENDIFMGPISTLADEKISLIPDFISNVGISRLAAYLMSDRVLLTDEALFGDVSKTIHKALKQCHQAQASPNKIAQTALEIALQQLG